jgi:CheY-like chemotaxis protein
MLDFITRQDMPAVLLIDDDMVSREVMATVLTMSGYPVMTAADGEAAVALLTAKTFAPAVRRCPA